MPSRGRRDGYFLVLIAVDKTSELTFGRGESGGRVPGLGVEIDMDVLPYCTAIHQILPSSPPPHTKSGERATRGLSLARLNPFIILIFFHLM